MKIQYLLDYLQENYTLTYTNLTFFDNVFYADLGITAPENPFGLKNLYSCGADQHKETSILKACIEMIERIVFVSPFVGAIEFLDNIPYVRSESGLLVQMEKVSLYFTQDRLFSSKGMACHTEQELAKQYAENEYYEKIILDNLSFYVKANSTLFNSYRFQHQIFENCLIKLNNGYFSIAWHKSNPEYALGSAFHNSADLAMKKAYQEAGGKWDIIEQNRGTISDMSSIQSKNSLIAGTYLCRKTINQPNMIKRQHKILSDLNLFLFQSVG